MYFSLYICWHSALYYPTEMSLVDDNCVTLHILGNVKILHILKNILYTQLYYAICYLLLAICYLLH